MILYYCLFVLGYFLFVAFGCCLRRRFFILNIARGNKDYAVGRQGSAGLGAENLENKRTEQTNPRKSKNSALL